MTARRCHRLRRTLSRSLWLCGLLASRAHGGAIVTSTTNESATATTTSATSTTTRLPTAKGQCEEQLTEGRCERNASGGTDMRCLWVGFSCITLPIGDAVASEDNGDSIAATTLEPSLGPTGAPTKRPTDMPVDSPTVYEVRSVMTLYGASQLYEDAIEAWTDVTQDWIHVETVKIIGEDNSVDVMVDFNGQNDGRMLRHHRGFPNRHRFLAKAEASSLRIDFTTVVEIDSDRYIDRDPNQIVAAGFRTRSQREEYLDALKSADGISFGSVVGMLLDVEGEIVARTTTPPPPLPNEASLQTTAASRQEEVVRPEERSAIYMIGGAMCGALALLLAGGFGAAYYARKSSSSSSSSSSMPSKSSPEDGVLAGKLDAPCGMFAPSLNPTTTTTATGNMTTTSASASQMQMQTQTQFGCSIGGTLEEWEQDDVSALQDPSFCDDLDNSRRHHADVTVGESMVSSERQLYEYGVRKGGGHGMHQGSPALCASGSRTDSTTVATDNSANLFADDGIFENFYRTPDGNANVGSYEDGCGPAGNGFQRLTVAAPAGKMGIVVDNPTGDVPAIHAVKESSALSGRVGVGDLLVSVDEVDCRGLSAARVTRLIGSRSENAVRNLVLLRCRSENPCPESC